MESRVQEAVDYIAANPGAKVATVAQKFGIDRSRLRRRLAGIGPQTSRPPTNTRLLAHEEAALCRYIDRLDKINLAVRPEFVTDAANYILRARASRAEQDQPPVVGQNWTSRFLKRHNYLKQPQKKLNSSRQNAEQPTIVAEWFDKLLKTLSDNGIDPEDI
jgi:transposase-like protein